MRVILTRPAHSSERTAHKLATLGHEPLLLPLTEPVHEPGAAMAALRASSGALAVTSAEAIRVLRSLGAALNPHLPRPLFAVGDQTARAAKDIGFTHTLSSDGDGEALADLIGSRRALLADQPLTYLAGSPRAEGFEARLAVHGIAVTSVEAYRMRDLNPDGEVLRRMLAESGASGILFYSSHAARRFFALPALRDVEKSLDHMRFYCLSEQIAAAVPPALQPQAFVSAQPSEEALLSLLEEDRPPQF